jgi:hypothetical protein
MEGNRMTVEGYLVEWMTNNPGVRVAPAELQFISAMRQTRAGGIGFGWMMQIIELEWNATCSAGGRWPEALARRTAEVEAINKDLLAILEELVEHEGYGLLPEVYDRARAAIRKAKEAAVE